MISILVYYGGITMTDLIGENAEQKIEVVFEDMFKRVGYMASLFQLAQDIATDERPLLNCNPKTNTITGMGMTITSFSDVPVSDKNDMLLAVGSPETGFYQVPIIKINGGKAINAIDVEVSGTIGDKAKAESFEKPRRLTEISKELYHGVGMEDANRVFAVALVPKADFLGDEVIVAGINNERRDKPGYSFMSSGSSVYHMVVNGFALERKIVSDNPISPVMYPGEDGSERYLKLGDMLDQEEVREMESKGVYPGLTFVTGSFEEEHVMRGAFFSMSAESKQTMGASRVGLEQGSESQVQYGRARGNITGIDGVLALHLIGVKEGTAPGDVYNQIEKLL